MFVARMITRSKWEPKPGIHAGEISADAVTGDLRTQDNSLSFWRCTSGTLEEIDEVALAIAAGRDYVAKVEIVLLKVEDLQADGQVLEDTKGHTRVKDLVGLHVDVGQLDYVRLGKVADRVVSALKEQRHQLLTRVRVRKLIVSAVAAGRVSLDDLKGKVRAEVEKSQFVE